MLFLWSPSLSSLHFLWTWDSSTAALTPSWTSCPENVLKCWLAFRFHKLLMKCRHSPIFPNTSSEVAWHLGPKWSSKSYMGLFPLWVSVSLSVTQRQINIFTNACFDCFLCEVKCICQCCVVTVSGVLQLQCWCWGRKPRQECFYPAVNLFTGFCLKI